VRRTLRPRLYPLDNPDNTNADEAQQREMEKDIRLATLISTRNPSKQPTDAQLQEAIDSGSL